MPSTGYESNLASEFHVLSLLYRLGLDASLTLGNKKAVDITVVLAEGKALTIDVKATVKKMDWLLGDGVFHDRPNHFFVLVSYESKFEDLTALPRCWVFPSAELLPFVKTASNQKTKFIQRTRIIHEAEAFEGAWGLIAVSRQTRISAQ